MAIQLNGTLKTEWGNTNSAYIRIEFYKVKPWMGEVEYNPILFLTSSDAIKAKKHWYQDPLPTAVPIVPLRDMEYESGSITGSFTLPELISFPVTASTERVNQEHWEEVWTSSSQVYVDFDENGDEVEVTGWVSSSQWTKVSESLQDYNRIDLDQLTDIYDQCYTHLKSVIAENIPSSSILDV